MPLRLVLMRHAKSSWKSDAPTDHERPLNKRGRKAAPKVGGRLAELGWVPDRVISSDSVRTRQTFEGMREPLGFDGDVLFTEDLYLAGVEEVRAALSGLEGEQTVLLLGHNPGWENTLAWLAGAAGEQQELKTGCAALLSHEAAAWSEAVAEGGDWELHEVVRPRELE